MNKVTRPISRLFNKGPRCSAKEFKYLSAFDSLIPFPNGSYLVGEDDRDDTSSISTDSTNATADNIPGPGRIIDKCIYQFFGRKIERFATRISISFLHPTRIVQFLRRDVELSPWSSPLSEGVVDIRLRSDLRCEPEARIAGLKSLVKQTQSNSSSLYRSAAALAALLSLCTSSTRFGHLYISIAEINSLFHLETLTEELADSNPEKRYFVTLINLARASLIHNKHRPTAQTLRRKLIKLLTSYRSHNDDPIVGMGGACLLLNECFLIVANPYDPPKIYKTYSISNSSIWETTYFVVIFYIQCINSLYLRSADTKSSTQQLDCLILYLHMRWFHYSWSKIKSKGHHITDPKLMQHVCALFSICTVATNLKFAIQETSSIPQITYRYHLPRRIRAITPEEEEPYIVHQQMQACIRRSCRLLSSFDELEREVQDSTSSTAHDTPQSGSDESCAMTYNEISFSRNRARENLSRKLQLSRWRWDPIMMWELEGEYETVARFHDRVAQAYASEKDLMWGSIRAVFSKGDHWAFRYYKENCRHRHRWGEYLRSNLDWDWDTASCLERLFKIEKPKELPRKGPPVRATIDTDDSSRCSLNVTIVDPHYPLEAVYVRYTTKSGEIKCMTFLPEENTQEY